MEFRAAALKEQVKSGALSLEDATHQLMVVEKAIGRLLAEKDRLVEAKDQATAIKTELSARALGIELQLAMSFVWVRFPTDQIYARIERELAGKCFWYADGPWRVLAAEQPGGVAITGYLDRETDRWVLMDPEFARFELRAAWLGPNEVTDAPGLEALLAPYAVEIRAVWRVARQAAAEAIARKYQAGGRRESHE